MSEPALSIVVVAYDMARELPRTLRSLAPRYQHGIDAGDYEVVVVDNGSPTPIDASMLGSLPGIRSIRLDDAPPSPAHAANVGLAAARGALVGVLLDGARMASPGLLAHARLAARLAARPVIATLAWHLGRARHVDADDTGYDAATEDELLAAARWEEDGYRLFGCSTLAGSSRRGWFGPLGESNALFLPAALWDELGGFDEAFALPGGGLVNHDAFHRACDLDGTELVVLLGEGTFHQIHGGASTSGQVAVEQARADYEARRGHPYSPPENLPLYVGHLHPAAVAHLHYSARWAHENRGSGAAAEEPAGVERDAEPLRQRVGDEVVP